MAIETAASTARATPPLTSNPCQTCRTICQQRCQRCRLTYYCSTECQKKDWRKHRLVCNTKNDNNKQPTPLEAWKELCQMVASSTTVEANQGFHQAQDEIVKLQQQEEEAKKKIEREKKLRKQQKEAQIQLPSVIPEETTNSEPANPLLRYQGPLSYTIEKMPNISMYQVLCRIPTTFQLQFCKAEIVTQCNLSLQLSPFEPPLQLRLPHPNMTIIGDPRLVELVEENHRALYLRLVDTDPTNMDQVSMDSNHRLLLQPQDAYQLACRTCRQRLIQKDSIQHAVLMPSSRWEDMADYLTCLDPTNTAVESLSSPSGSGKPNHLFQDTTTFVVHVDNVMETSVCVLGVPGYGQEDTMEDILAQNTWMQNSIGATLTCSRCADVLGEASTVDTFRMFHHKLCLHEQQPSIWPTLGSFLANELVRHAETHAVYSFGVVHQTQPHRLLHIQLVSWDSQVASSNESCIDASGIHQLQWRPVAKVLFYETTTQSVEGSPSLLWQTDWCCDPSSGTVASTASTTTTNNTIKMYLAPFEWTSLKDELTELSKQQVREIADATILAKTGNAASNEMRLATICRN